MDYSDNQTLENFRNAIEAKLSTIAKSYKPNSLYEPVRYAVEGGGKRLRPVIVLTACEAMGGNPEDALDAAVAVELLHTFTLVHDDIMDADTWRRGRESVYKKWNSSSAILSGDALLVLAYQSLMRTKTDDIATLLKLFNDGALGVCEGQALDIELENKEDVSNSEYLNMIEKKTGMMISMAVSIGALIGGAGSTDLKKFKSFGLALGKAFQLQDDYLEITSSKSVMGKSLGSDLTKGKKTFLLINALKMANEEQHDALKRIINKTSITSVELSHVRDIFEECGVLDLTKSSIDENISASRESLDFLDAKHRKDLLEITELIQSRKN